MRIHLPGLMRICLVSMTALLFLTACSPSVVLTIKDDASGTARFNAEISPSSENLVRRFMGSGNAGTETQIFDRDKIIISLARAGFKVDSLTFPTRTGIILALSFLKLDGLLNQAVVLNKDSKSIAVTLSADSVNAAIDLMPPNTKDYMDLLMAPIFTGEEMTAKEYEDLIGAAYGKTLADELKKTVFSLTVHCPEDVTDASINGGGNAATLDKTAVFTIPLSTLLAMQKTLTARAEW